MNGIDLQIISVIVGILIGLGTLIAGCGFAYAQFKTGGDKAKDDLIQTLKETAIVERDKSIRLSEEKATLVDSHQAQINELKREIGKLQGLYEASESSKKEYLSILQGRDPAQKAFMENQQRFMELVMGQIKKNDEVAPQAQKYMEETTRILAEIRIFMENLNRNSSENKQFLSEVETSTRNEEGKVLRRKDES